MPSPVGFVGHDRAAPFLTHLEFDLKSPVWRPWLGELGRDNLRVRYDGRGCGLSDAHRSSCGIEQSAA